MQPIKSFPVSAPPPRGPSPERHLELRPPRAGGPLQFRRRSPLRPRPRRPSPAAPPSGLFWGPRDPLGRGEPPGKERASRLLLIHHSRRGRRGVGNPLSLISSPPSCPPPLPPAEPPNRDLSTAPPSFFWSVVFFAKGFLPLPLIRAFAEAPQPWGGEGFPAACWEPPNTGFTLATRSTGLRGDLHRWSPTTSSCQHPQLHKPFPPPAGPY